MTDDEIVEKVYGGPLRYTVGVREAIRLARVDERERLRARVGALEWLDPWADRRSSTPPVTPKGEMVLFRDAVLDALREPSGGEA